MILIYLIGMDGKGARSLVVGLYIGGEIDERAEKTKNTRLNLGNLGEALHNNRQQSCNNNRQQS
jgi:hypothetical protein